MLFPLTHEGASAGELFRCPILLPADVFLTYSGEGGGVSPDLAPCRAFRNAFHLRSAASSAAPFDPVLPGVFVSLQTRGRSGGVSAGSAVPVMFFLSRSGALVPVRRLRFLSLESRRGCAVMVRGASPVRGLMVAKRRMYNNGTVYKIKMYFLFRSKRARKCIIHAGKGINLHKNRASSQITEPAYIR